MSVKDLEPEFVSLKKEFGDLKQKIDNLIEKYGNLEKRYEKCLTKKKKAVFKCRKCGEKCESLKDLKKHKQEEKCSGDKFQCDECERYFLEERKLEEHVNRVHKLYGCDECEKEFKYERNLEKHIEAVHEDCKLFCHYFNNDKDCPFDEECIYIHEESEICKFGLGCERVLCMFRHEERNYDEESDEEESDDESVSEGNSNDKESVNALIPVLEKVKAALEKFDDLLQKCSLKCKQCDFEAKDKNGLVMHMKSKHKNVNNS